jgi:hypothetical protein
MFKRLWTPLTLLPLLVLSFLLGGTGIASAHPATMFLSKSSQISPAGCSNPGWEAEIHSTQSGPHCYIGAGYTGIYPNIYNVDFLSAHCANVWFMTYKQNGSPGVKVSLNYATSGSVNGPWYKVTQIEIDGVYPPCSA